MTVAIFTINIMILLMVEDVVLGVSPNTISGCFDTTHSRIKVNLRVIFTGKLNNRLTVNTKRWGNSIWV